MDKEFKLPNRVILQRFLKQSSLNMLVKTMWSYSSLRTIGKRWKKNWPQKKSQKQADYTCKTQLLCSIFLQRWSQIAFVKSVVEDFPPRSAVRYFPSAIVLRMAFWIRSALSWSSKWRSIVTELNSNAVGFAKF